MPRADTYAVPLFQVTRISTSHRKVLGYVPATDGVAALREWGARGLVPGDWLEAERVYGFSDEEEGTETAADGNGARLANWNAIGA